MYSQSSKAVSNSTLDLVIRFAVPTVVICIGITAVLWLLTLILFPFQRQSFELKDGKLLMHGYDAYCGGVFPSVHRFDCIDSWKIVKDFIVISSNGKEYSIFNSFATEELENLFSEFKKK